MALLTADDRRWLELALDEARAGRAEGGIPIGACLVADGRLLGRGHNRRVQSGDPILHGEMDALRAAGRLTPAQYRRATMYTTLSPCAMCSGALVLYGIPRVVLAENRTFRGEEDWLQSRGVEVVNADLAAAVELMRELQRERPDLWREDIGSTAALS
jgi:cytosine deaminase